MDKMNPVEIQRKRTKGFNLQKESPNGLPVIYVGRPTKFGNTWTVEKYWDAGYSGSEEVARQHCVDAYRAWLEGKPHWAHGAILPPRPDLSELRGKNLACWCRIGTICHRTVLLELANK